jgi:hypothetical protein
MQVKMGDGLTDDHEGELDTLLDLVSSASAGERHFVGSLTFGCFTCVQSKAETKGKVDLANLNSVNPRHRREFTSPE